MTLGGLLSFGSESGVFVNNRAAVEICSWVGLGMILASYFLLGHGTPYPSYRALLPCIGTVLFLGSQRKHLSTCGRSNIILTYFCSYPIQLIPSICRLLSWKPLVQIGKISYSLYLWHWPVYVLLLYKLPSVDGNLGYCEMSNPTISCELTSCMYVAVHSRL
jgi:peptidoglycan/LPS O-acetylase OafA/YrhL